MAVVREFGNFLNLSAGSAESIKDYLKICSILHGNDSQLILLVYPNKESLFLVVENTSAVGPISVKSNCLKESVSLLEKEVVINELLLLGLCKVVQGIVCSSKIPSEALNCLSNALLNLESLLVGDTRAKREPVKISSYPDSCTLDHLCVLF